MKKYFNLLSLLLVIFSCSLSNLQQNEVNLLDNVLNNDVSKKGKVSISFNQGRTVMPEVYDKTIYTYEFKGKLNQKEFNFGEYTYTQLMELKQEVDVGLWDFTLIAKKSNEKILVGQINNKNIDIGDTTLNFNMVPYENGVGDISVTIKIPQTKVEKIVVKLCNLADDTVIESKTITDSNIVAIGTVYEKSNVKRGYYNLYVEVYQNKSDECCRNSKMTVVRVEPGCLSSGEISFDKVDTLYSIKYNLNGANYVSNYIPPTSYIGANKVLLPIAEKITCPNGLSILGWYTNSDCLGKAVTSIDYDNTGDKEYWLKIEKKIDVSSLDSYLSTLEVDDTVHHIVILDTNPNLTTIKTALQNHLDVKVGLILDGCTGLQTIDSNAFNGCSNLADLVLPNSVTHIYSGALSGCSNLKYLTIPFVGARKDATTASAETLFGYIFGTNSYTGGVATRQIYAFDISPYNYSSCYYIPSSLKSVTVTGGQLLYGAFDKCIGLTSVEIGDGVTSIGDYAFNDCIGLTSVYYNGTIAQWCDISFNNYTSNPLYCAHNLYINNELVTNLVIPDSVTSIGDYAFYGCRSLTSIEIPNSVTSIGDYAFYGCRGLRSVKIGDDVISIGKGAFQECNSLTSVEIGDSVTSIGRDAFENCKGLTSVYYNGTIAQWCDISFNNYSSSPLYYANNLYINNELVTNLVIPDSVTSIGDYAFYSCSSLTSIEIPNSVTSIGVSAFCGCSSLTSIEIPDSVTSIGKEAFRSCSSLTSIEIPDSVTSIGEGTFDSCSSLEHITIPFVGKSKDATVASRETLFGYFFGSGVFAEGVSIKQYYSYSSYGGCCIPSSLKSVTVTGGQLLRGAFMGCSSLTSIEIPGVTSIETDAFSGCCSLTSVYYNGTIAQWCDISFNYYTSNPLYYGAKLYINNELVTNLVIPNSVTSIEKYAFYGCRSLTSIEIPNSVRSIGDYAFSGCSSLTSIEIPDSVTSIGVRAFYRCSSLTSIEVPDSVTSIGEGTFQECNSLTSVEIGDSVTSIGHVAFDNCKGLTSVYYNGTIAQWCDISFNYYTSNPLYYGAKLYINNELVTNLVIPDSVTSIGVSAFCGCSSLISIEIPDSVTSIGDYAFDECRSLTSVKIGDSVTSIGDYAFDECSSLTSVYYNGTIAQWCDISFNNYSSSPLYYANNLYINNELVTNLVIPDSVTSIGDYAFYSCSSLISIEIPDSVTSIGDYAFYRCRSLTSVKIPDSVTSIGDIAFDECWSLTSIEIPDSVTSIGSMAFCGCSSLTSIEIPDSVTSIGRMAFYYCFGLTTLTCKATTPPSLNDRPFPSNLSKIYVPTNSVSLYKSAAGWSDFASKIIGMHF